MRKTLACVLLTSGLLAGLPSGCTSNKLESLVCNPSCPAGTLCTPDGCVPEHDVALPDAAVPDAAGDCDPPCAGAAPFCSASHQCVACIADESCPIGFRCRMSGGTAACLPGCANRARCGGTASADCCSGECVDTATDPAHCGACGHACPSFHAEPTCAGGECSAGPCEVGWADCNASSTDGCETNLRLDGESCGACGKKCQLPNGVPGCAGGCYLVACVFGFDDCNGDAIDGCETSVLSDPRNCGKCGVMCPAPPHARNACVNGACQLTSCNAGFSDCDGDPRNGCEVSTGNDLNNCGSCGIACGVKQVCINGGCTCQQCNIAHAKTRCVNLACVLDSCLAGFADCNANPNDGCEVDLTGDASNCGACNAPCGGKTPYCQGGMCSDVTPSCNDIIKGNPRAPDGLYTIDPDGNGPVPPYQVYCDMTTDGGGWTAYFSGINGSPNAFAHFEDVAVDCKDPATRCLRRLPAVVTIANQFLATCGNASVRFNINQTTLSYFANGTQGGTWIANSNQTAIGGGANPTFARNTWTGSGNNKGWIVSAGDGLQPQTFSSSYNVNNQWDLCNGVIDVVTPIRLSYR